MNVSYYIAKRYLRSKSSNNAINFITYLAIIGIVLGSASLLVVLSGFAGLKDFTLEFSTIIDPDLKVETVIGKSFTTTAEQDQKLNTIEGVTVFSKVIEERVLVSFDENKHPAYIKGVDENYSTVNVVDSIIRNGSWLTPKTNQIVSGYGVANILSIGVLDYGKSVSLFVPKPGKGQITSQKQAFKQLNSVNVGIFDVNEKLNDSYIYSSIDFAQELLSFDKNEITGIEFKLDENANEETVRSQIQSILGNTISIKNRTQLNDALYKMLNTEHLAVYLILTLVSIILIFNVIGSLIMMILDKKKTLNTLFSMGTTLQNIRRIFFFQGVTMTVLGTIVGLIIGCIVVVLQQQFSLVMITQKLPYPMALSVENCFLVFITITVLGIIASKLASVRISESMLKTE